MSEHDRTVEDLLAEIAKAKAETEKLKRDARLIEAAKERKIPLDLLKLVDGPDKEEALVVEALDRLAVLMDEGIKQEVDRRYKSIGREPYRSQSPTSAIKIAEMTAQEISANWASIAKKLEQGKIK